MNPKANSHTDSENSAALMVWHFLGQWRLIAVVSIVLLLLTLNPLFAGCLPYFKAGWPSVKTAFWLKKTDPWKARGTVGLLFHQCMSLFRAGACGLACIVGTAITASVLQKDPDLIPFTIALATITLGCSVSFIFGWLGIAIALRHGVRIFVMSNLYDVCKGDFEIAKTLGPGRNGANPANYIVGVAVATPLLAIWFAAMLFTLPENRNNQHEMTPFIILGLLPVLAIVCVVVVAFLSMRIMARSPAECWGAEMPEFEEVASSWYQSTD